MNKQVSIATSNKAFSDTLQRLFMETRLTVTNINTLSDPVLEATWLLILDTETIDITTPTLDTIPKTTNIILFVNDSIIPKIQLFSDPKILSIFRHKTLVEGDEFMRLVNTIIHWNIFGLNKHMVWNTPSILIEIKNAKEKKAALIHMFTHLSKKGVRSAVRDNIEAVTDEILMNALYHAPVDKHGNERYANISRKELASFPNLDPITMQYCINDNYFGLAVRDQFGSLAKQNLVKYLNRSKNSETVIENKTSGAGLGLLHTLQLTSKLVFNINQDVSTEVIALFDLKNRSRNIANLDSLHILTSQSQPNNPSQRIKISLHKTRIIAFSSLLFLALTALLRIWI